MIDEPPPRPPRRSHRRQLAYVAMLALCGISVGAFIRELSEPNADVVMALIYAFAAILLGYLGAQVAPDVFRRK